MKPPAIALGIVLLLPVSSEAASMSSLRRDPAKEAWVKTFLRNTLALELDVRVVVDPALESANTICAYATTEGGVEYIGINKTCVTDLSQPWSAGVMAHECAHLLSGHGWIIGKSARTQDHDVEQFVGWAFARTGRSIEDARRYAASGPEQATSTHIGRVERIAAVEAGYSIGAGIQAGSISALPSVPPNGVPPSNSNRLDALVEAAKRQMQALKAK